jgi:ribosomal-protein-alanine N-acetyltransferase
LSHQKSIIPTFETTRLILKMISPDDYSYYRKNINDYEVIKHLSAQVPWPYPADGVETFMNNVVIPKLGHERWFWGIFLKENLSEVIGAVDLWRVPCPENRGFWLAKKYWNKGIMSEAVKVVNDYAFRELGFEKLFLTNALGNLASRKIKEKNGAKFIGVKDAKFVSPDYHQTEIWELSKVDWLKHTRPSFIGHYQNFQEEDNACYPGSSELLSIGSPVGKKLGLQKIGVHIEKLPIGRRTSWPHAESLEEEFVYVIKGTPDVWINGTLHPLMEGDFVAFPSGTGIAHTFINNSDQEVIILVGGEANKKENQIYYPLHPKRNMELKEKNMFWEDWPKQNLGNHNSIPNTVNQASSKNVSPS